MKWNHTSSKAEKHKSAQTLHAPPLRTEKAKGGVKAENHCTEVQRAASTLNRTSWS